MLWSQSFWSCPGAMGEGRDCSLYLVLTEVLRWSGSVWGRDSIRSDGTWGCFCSRVSRDSLLGLTKELPPDSICKAPLILKSDSFWFTRLFIFVAGSLWALFGCGVACLGETLGFGRLSDSRYVLILDFMELVREIPLDPGPDDRMERGKH